MKGSEVLLTMVRGIIAGLDTLDQARVAECAAKLREVILGAGEYGLMALSLVMAESRYAGGVDGKDRFGSRNGPQERI